MLEMLIVIAVIAIVVSIVIPNLISSRIEANESAALATLRQIGTAQAHCRTSGFIDVNGNGTGEFAFIGELSGRVGVRTDEVGGVGSAVLRPSLLTVPEQLAGTMLRSGYYYRMYLPGGTLQPQGEASAGGGSGVSVNALSAEVMWCCYAWPASHGISGHRTLFLNQRGDVLATRNSARRYSGTTNMPPGSAAFLFGSSGHMASSVAANATGLDGQFWLVIG